LHLLLELTLFEIDKTSGNTFIGTNGSSNSTLNSKLEVQGGDIFINQIASGIILKSPNGNCWRVTIDNTGNLQRIAITCP